MNRRLLGDRHPDIARCLTAKADLYNRTGRSEEAEVLARQAREMFAETLAPDHWRTAWAGNVEGAALLQLGRLKQAETALQQSYDTLRDDAGVRDAHLLRVLENLALLHERRHSGPPSRSSFSSMPPFVETRASLAEPSPPAALPSPPSTTNPE